MAKRDRDEAVDRVGRELFGDLWIGRLSKYDWLRRHVTDLPIPAKQAASAARGAQRFLMLDWQNGRVLRWLILHGIDPTVEGFDKRAFETWFAKTFAEKPVSTTSKRQQAVRARLDAGHQPGRGGESWKSFAAAIQRATGLQFNLKTLQRDVSKIAPSK